MAHDDPDDRGRRRAAPHTPETAGLERLRSWACLDADSVPHACPNFSDTVVLGRSDGDLGPGRGSVPRGCREVGTTEDLFRRPRTRFVAEFIGRTNLVDAGL